MTIFAKHIHTKLLELNYNLDIDSIDTIINNTKKYISRSNFQLKDYAEDQVEKLVEFIIINQRQITKKLILKPSSQIDKDVNQKMFTAMNDITPDIEYEGLKNCLLDINITYATDSKISTIKSDKSLFVNEAKNIIRNLNYSDIKKSVFDLLSRFKHYLSKYNTDVPSYINPYLNCYYQELLNNIITQIMIYRVSILHSNKMNLIFDIVKNFIDSTSYKNIKQNQDILYEYYNHIVMLEMRNRIQSVILDRSKYNNIELDEVPQKYSLKSMGNKSILIDVNDKKYIKKMILEGEYLHMRTYNPRLEKSIELIDIINFLFNRRLNNNDLKTVKAVFRTIFSSNFYYSIDNLNNHEYVEKKYANNIANQLLSDCKTQEQHCTNHDLSFVNELISRGMMREDGLYYAYTKRCNFQNDLDNKIIELSLELNFETFNKVIEDFHLKLLSQILDNL